MTQYKKMNHLRMTKRKPMRPIMLTLRYLCMSLRWWKSVPLKKSSTFLLEKEEGATNTQEGDQADALVEKSAKNEEQ